jgi:ABC-type sugar transport system ATPase subunit
LLRIIAGLEKPTSGSIHIGGVEMTTVSPRSRDVAMVSQSHALYPRMTVKQNLAFPLKMRKERPDVVEQRIQHSAELLGIGKLLSRRTDELSGGEQQRVAIGRVIVRTPSLFLFDEPLAHLDSHLRWRLREELHHVFSTLSTTTLYVTHDLDEAAFLCDQILVLDHGRVLQMNTTRQVIRAPASVQVARLLGIPESNLLRGTLKASSEKGVRFIGAEFEFDVEGGLLESAQGRLTKGEANAILCVPSHAIDLVPCESLDAALSAFNRSKMQKRNATIENVSMTEKSGYVRCVVRVVSTHPQVAGDRAEIEIVSAGHQGATSKLEQIPQTPASNSPVRLQAHCSIRNLVANSHAIATIDLAQTCFVS